MTLLIVFTVGISLLTCALNVRFRDVNFFIQALLIIWFYATPIVYSLSQIPPHLLWLWRLNPLTSILQLFQHAFVGAVLPGIAMLASNIAVIILISFLGVVVFQHEHTYFDDWV
jgi:ABC-type polysaccharide/polyol phosphate export permease